MLPAGSKSYKTPFSFVIGTTWHLIFSRDFCKLWVGQEADFMVLHRSVRITFLGVPGPLKWVDKYVWIWLRQKIHICTLLFLPVKINLCYHVMLDYYFFFRQESVTFFLHMFKCRSLFSSIILFLCDSMCFNKNMTPLTQEKNIYQNVFSIIAY